MKTKMKCLLIKVLLISFSILVGSGLAYAYPKLQLDIKDGTYVGVPEESIFATSNSFTLYALLVPNGNSLSDTYYISAALRPITTSPADVGSFTFNGTTVNVTNDMVYGTAPFEENLLFDAKDLSKHGIFETYYTEFSFLFDVGQTTQAYNTQDNAGQGPTDYTSGEIMYYKGFNIDTSLLAAGYSIHFDLYNVKFRNGDTDVDLFAPFSHDAEGTKQVPEPTTLLLIGLGMIGVVGISRKLKK